jgi:hypothetical protein
MAIELPRAFNLNIEGKQFEWVCASKKARRPLKAMKMAAG